MKTVRVAVNGFGRIGRAFFRLAVQDPRVEVVAVNDLGDVENLAYLLKYDSVYGRAPFEVQWNGSGLIVAGKEIPVYHGPEPAKLPWGTHAVDVVVESTGVFTRYATAKAHVDGGAKRVVISAPAKDEPEESGVPGATVLMGVNTDVLKTCLVSSNASCTTNAAAPVMHVLEEALDIEKALLDTIHGYTSSQSLVDGPSKKDFRRGRAGAHNIVPSSTGAANAVRKAVSGVPFFDGIAVRVPVIAGSYIDLTMVTKQDTSTEAVNRILKKAAAEDRWQGILSVSDEPLVSSDIVGTTYASIVDLAMTRVVGGNLIKVLAWYDNEMGYASMLLKHVIETGRYV